MNVTTVPLAPIFSQPLHIAIATHEDVTAYFLTLLRFCAARIFLPVGVSLYTSVLASCTVDVIFSKQGREAQAIDLRTLLKVVIGILGGWLMIH